MSKDDPKLILDAIAQAIERELNKVYEEEKTRLIERLEAEKTKVIASAALLKDELEKGAGDAAS